MYIYFYDNHHQLLLNEQFLLHLYCIYTEEKWTIIIIIII